MARPVEIFRKHSACSSAQVTVKGQPRSLLPGYRGQKGRVLSIPYSPMALPVP